MSGAENGAQWVENLVQMSGAEREGQETMGVGAEHGARGGGAG